jgi:hypothetical protein
MIASFPRRIHPAQIITFFAAICVADCPCTRTQAAAEATGAVPALQQRIDRGEVQLSFDAERGYLLSLLKELQVPQASQLLVYSKTSCQRERISPQTPRAVYFSDRAYVAWLPGSPLLEISSVEPKFGAVFYTLEQKPAAKPQIIRRDQCLECHTGTATLNVPGYLVRSYATDDHGVIDVINGSSMVDHRTPWPERWGGWYVAGSVAPTNTPLSRVSNLAIYPQQTTDTVALMVLEHQAQMQNLITRLNYEATQRTPPSGAAESERATLDAFVKYLLFADEVTLNSSIQGNAAFITWFENQGPKDKQGRSLRQLDLKTRLLKYPCSYMIYSEAFGALPREARLHLYRRLWKILNGEDTDTAFQRIPAAAKRAILEILIDTKADVPIDWKL